MADDPPTTARRRKTATRCGSRTSRSTAGEELDNSRRQFLKFLGLTSFAFFTGTLGVALKAAI